MNVYPAQLRVVLIYLEALDEAEKKVIALNEEYAPYPQPIQLADRDGTKWGELRDEIGGSWSWTPPSPEART